MIQIECFIFKNNIKLSFRLAREVDGRDDQEMAGLTSVPVLSKWSRLSLQEGLRGTLFLRLDWRRRRH